MAKLNNTKLGGSLILLSIIPILIILLKFCVLLFGQNEFDFIPITFEFGLIGMVKGIIYLGLFISGVLIAFGKDIRILIPVILLFVILIFNTIELVFYILRETALINLVHLIYISGILFILFLIKRNKVGVK